jgi:hypothetical protein
MIRQIAPVPPQAPRILHSFDYRLYDSTKPLRGQTALYACVADTLAVPQTRSAS